MRRRRLGELRCLSPLPLGLRAAAPAPLPGGGCEPVGARAFPPGPARHAFRGGPQSRTASPGDLARFRLLGGTPPRAREGWTPAGAESDPSRADAARVSFNRQRVAGDSSLSAGAVRRRDLDSPDRPGVRT